MFVQFIRGKLKNEQGARAAMDKWEAELKSGATGFLGTTAGVTSAGELVALVRFESEEAARRNSERPEQAAWWAEMEKNYDGPVQFLDSSEVQELLGGGSDEAGFVQVMRGVVKDRAVVDSMSAQMEPELRRLRPDLLGGYFAFHPDGSFTNVAYFESEEAARKGEASGEFSEVAERMMAAAPFEEFLDIRDPWMQ